MSVCMFETVYISFSFFFGIPNNWQRMVGAKAHLSRGGARIRRAIFGKNNAPTKGYLWIRACISSPNCTRSKRLISKSIMTLKTVQISKEEYYNNCPQLFLTYAQSWYFRENEDMKSISVKGVNITVTDLCVLCSWHWQCAEKEDDVQQLLGTVKGEEFCLNMNFKNVTSLHDSSEVEEQPIEPVNNWNYQAQHITDNVRCLKQNILLGIVQER